jgi:hypothetical protein
MSESYVEILLEASGAVVAQVEFSIAGPNSSATGVPMLDADPVWLRIVAAPRKLCTEGDFMPFS